MNESKLPRLASTTISTVSKPSGAGSWSSSASSGVSRGSIGNKTRLPSGPSASTTSPGVPAGSGKVSFKPLASTSSSHISANPSSSSTLDHAQAPDQQKMSTDPACTASSPTAPAPTMEQPVLAGGSPHVVGPYTPQPFAGSGVDGVAKQLDDLLAMAEHPDNSNRVAKVEAPKQPEDAKALTTQDIEDISSLFGMTPQDARLVAVKELINKVPAWPAGISKQAVLVAACAIAAANKVPSVPGGCDGTGPSAPQHSKTRGSTAVKFLVIVSLLSTLLCLAVVSGLVTTMVDNMCVPLHLE